ncbi:glial cell line-derived neurotrophic factor [Entelurus aequoreus]|uniref:glial cell line-derived neurotrophic factor n=1 Tax=Entelurus aequoreus TaxID=161455 RepID=UPI002B1E35DE|nr:glial cell line-derived neurotrophic factor [Entelurus aequoreus]
MKLWDVAAMCLLLLSSVATRPLYHPSSPQQPDKRTFPDAHPSQDDREETLLLLRRRHAERSLQDVSMEDQYDTTDPDSEHFDDVMDFIEDTIGRLRRSSESRVQKEQRQRGSSNSRGPRGERRRGRSRGKGGRGERGRGRTSVQSRGCLLKEVHLNVTDLGLGYQTKEELIFRYCSGPCAEAETNYDKILNNLSHSRRLDKDTPARTCCRPIAFDDDLSFLDDNVVYHTLKKHSAKKCGCV